MNISLLNLKDLYLKLSGEDFKNVFSVISMMLKENINLVGWELVEIPAEQTYCFYNDQTENAFDFEENCHGNLCPHYYKYVMVNNINKIPTETIRDAILKYEI